VALVTGASRGLGLASARSLAGEGCAVAVAARGEEGVAAAVAGLEAMGARTHGIALDMADAGGPARAVAEAEEALGPLDVVVGNAGGPPPGRFVDVDEDGWDLALLQNFMGTVRLIRAAVPGMRRRGFGRVVTITSSAAREPIDGLALSNAARAGVASVVRTLAREVAEDGVTVNNVMPGPILTDRQREILGAAGDLEAALAERARRNPTARLGAAEEVGDLVAFLASARAGFITGVSIFIDGGEARAAA